MKNLFKVVAVFATLTMLVGAMFAVTMSASAEVQEVVLYESSDAFTAAPGASTVGIVAIDAIDDALKSDYATNGAINKDAGEYYAITVTGVATGASGYATPGFYVETPTYQEVWGTDGFVGTTEGTITAKVAVAMDFSSMAKLAFFSDGAADDAVSGSYLKISVYRDPANAPTTTASSEATTVSTSESTAATTAPTEPSADETEPSATATSVSDVVDPTATATTTGTGVVEINYGDVNGDGEVDMKDVLNLRKFLADMEVENFDDVAADMNQDGEVDMKDVLALRKAIAGMTTL